MVFNSISQQMLKISIPKMGLQKRTDTNFMSPRTNEFEMETYNNVNCIRG